MWNATLGWDGLNENVITEDYLLDKVKTVTLIMSEKNICLTSIYSYTPTLLWGKNGHIQSFIFAIIGRFGKNSDLSSKRYEDVAKDGSIVTYDVFTPKKHEVPGK